RVPARQERMARQSAALEREPVRGPLAQPTPHGIHVSRRAGIGPKKSWVPSSFDRSRSRRAGCLGSNPRAPSLSAMHEWVEAEKLVPRLPRVRATPNAKDEIVSSIHPR